MLDLVLAVVSSALIAILMRVSADKVKNNISMLAVNYLICLAVGGVYAGGRLLPSGAEGFSTALGMGVFNGFLFLSSFMAMQFNTAKNGIVLTSIFMRLGLLVPMTLSVAVFGEMPTALQAAGFVIAVAAIILINFEKGTGSAGSKLSLMVLLLLGGSCDAMSKIYERLGTAALSDQFLFYTFAMAFVLCSALAIFKKERPGIKEALYGALIGIPNFFSAKFLLGSLEELDAVIVYPTYSVATILVVTLTGVVVFRERLKKRQWVALAAILAALVLLNI